MRRGTLLAAAALVAASCSGSTAETSTTATSSPATTAPATTTTAAPATTTSTTTTMPQTTTTVDPLARPDKLVSNFDRDSVDDFDTTGDDLYRVVMELDDLFNFLEGNPTSSAEEMVGLMFDPAYPHWDSLVQGFDELAVNDWRYSDDGMETTAVEIVSASNTQATARITSRRAEQVIVDGSGLEVRRMAGWDLDIATFDLTRGNDGRWRYSSVTSFEVPEPEEVDAMVPVEWTGRTE